MNRIILLFLALILPGFVAEGADFDKPVDIFAVGFEEIVDLNASNIVSAR